MGVVTHERAAPIHVRSGRGVRGESFKCGESRWPASCGRRLPDIDAGQRKVSGYRTFRRRSRLNHSRNRHRGERRDRAVDRRRRAGRRLRYASARGRPERTPRGQRAARPEIIFKTHASKAFVEFVGARPGEGAVGAFAFGRSRGVVEGVLGAAGVLGTTKAPAAWKRAVGLPEGREGAKDAARPEAIRRWPAKAAFFARVRDVDRAEACLIALAGLRREAQP
jgi:crossover junction endodeoxyribonuclease RuvC